MSQDYILQQYFEIDDFYNPENDLQEYLDYDFESFEDLRDSLDEIIL
jgi:hypothetical protein